MHKEGAESDDSDDGESSSEELDLTQKRGPKKESNLFTVLGGGVSKNEEEAQIRRDFKN